MAAARFPDSSTPVAVDGVETAVFEGEAVLYRESTGTIHRLGAVAGAVWVSCDGATTVEQMVDDLCEAFGGDRAELAAQVQDSLGHLADEGLLDGNAAPARLRFEPLSEPASDGSRVIACPPDF